MPQPIGISASRGSAILGVNKYKSPLYAWLEIMEQLKPGFCKANGYNLPERLPEWDEPLNPKMASIRWGHAFEDAICTLTGGITDREKLYESNEYGFPMTCHIDGLKNGRVQENKTAFDMAFRLGWGEPESNMVPEAYQVQIQQQMYLTGLTHGDFNVLVFPKAPAQWEAMGYRVSEVGDLMTINEVGKSKLIFAGNLKDFGYFHHFHVEADKEVQKTMIEMYKTFWNDNVLKEVPPPVQGYDDIKYLIASPEGEIEATQEMRDLWDERNSILNEISDMEKRADECKDNFARMVQVEIQSKNVKEGCEKNKLNIMAGARKLASVTKARPSLKVSAPMVSSIKDTMPDLYEKIKKVSFLDILPEELDLTEKQKEKLDKADADFDKLATDRSKLLKSLKLTKLLSKDSIVKHLEKHQPDLYNALYEHGIVETTAPQASFRMTRQEDE